MAFPLTPIVGDTHTEAGLRFRWSGNSWDHIDSERAQELYLSTVDPTPSDTAPYGSIWRNTTTGEAYRAEENRRATGSIITEGTLSSVVSGTSSGINRVRQSLTSPPAGAVVLSKIDIKLLFFSGTNSVDITVDLFAGEDVISGVSDLPSLSPVLDSVTESISHPSPGSSGYEIVSFVFPSGGVVVSGKHTVVLTMTNVLGTQPAFSFTSDGSYTGGQYGPQTADDLRFEATYTTVGGLEWNKVQSRQDVLAVGPEPTFKSDGTNLIDGDFWFEGVSNEWHFRSAGQWSHMRAYYDNSIASVLTSSNTQSAIEEIDAVVDVIGGGSRFIGTYAPISNTVDFTASSGYADGTLPAANTLVPADFLVVTEQAIGQAPAPAVQMYKGDYLIADTVNNVWIHLQLGNPLISFLDLADTPTSYTGEQFSALSVNSLENGIEFVQSGDVQSFYDSSAPTSLIVGNQWNDSITSREKVAPIAGSSTLWQEQVYVQTSSGVPPSTPYSGQLWYDNSSNTLYIYDVSTTPASWVSL